MSSDDPNDGADWRRVTKRGRTAAAGHVRYRALVLRSTAATELQSPVHFPYRTGFHLPGRKRDCGKMFHIRQFFGSGKGKRKVGEGQNYYGLDVETYSFRKKGSKWETFFGPFLNLKS